MSEAMSRAIDFMDAAAFAEVVDVWSEPGARIDIGQDLIDQFSDMTGDHNWIHVDVARARLESPFGATIAHGNLVLVLLPRIRPVEAWHVVGHRQAVNRGFDRIRFVRPVLAGSTLYCRARLIKAQAAGKGMDLTKQYCVYGEDDQAVMSADIVLRYA